MHTRAMELPTPAGLEAFIGVCHSIQWVAFERRWIGSGMDWAREVSMEIWMGPRPGYIGSVQVDSAENVYMFTSS